MDKSRRYDDHQIIGRRRPALLAAVAGMTAIAVTTADNIRADVLYDTTWMTDEQSYTWFAPCHVSGLGSPGVLQDVQTADDFELAGTYVITSVTSDSFNDSPDSFPANGVLVEFFADRGGTPSEVPSIQVLTSAVTETPFNDTVFGNSGHRITVDLSGEVISLGPGTWWVSIVPVDETPSGVNYKQTRTLGLTIGFPAHSRDGGIDHGTGYDGVYNHDDWEAPLPFGDGAIAMKIEGSLVVPACPWDLGGDEVVGTSDLLDLLAAWGTDPGGPPDFDGDQNVGTSDLLELLANWGPC